jgi:hypothetical protein
MKYTTSLVISATLMLATVVGTSPKANAKAVYTLDQNSGQNQIENATKTNLCIVIAGKCYGII